MLKLAVVILLCTLSYYIYFIAASSDVNSKDCHKLLGQLGDKQSHFVQCSTKNAYPVNLCMGCHTMYTDMNASYINLENDKNCTIYFNGDRLNLVATTQKILNSLWTKAHCEDCFNTNHAEVFYEKLEALTNCTKDYSVKDVCFACVGNYTDLNDFYKQLDYHNNGQVCYDLQDAMNRTRTQWSSEYHCCAREFDPTLFTVACSMVAILPLLFYGGTFAYTKRQELRQGQRENADSEDPTKTNLTVAQILERARELQRQRLQQQQQPMQQQEQPPLAVVAPIGAAAPQTNNTNDEDVEKAKYMDKVKPLNDSDDDDSSNDGEGARKARP